MTIRGYLSKLIVLIAIGLAGLLGSVAGPAAAQSGGDNLWNIRVNGDDRFHSNESWIRPWRFDYDDGWGRWVGYYAYHIPWSGTYTQPTGNLGRFGWTIDPNGNLHIGADRDHQFHAWTFVYTTAPLTLPIPGGGDCVPRIFVNYAFDSPTALPGSIHLVAGMNRIDITGYHQHAGYSFHLNCALADLVASMNSVENRPPTPDANGPYVGNEGSPILFDASGSTDPDGNALQYRWDFDNDGVWDTGWSPDPTAGYTWYDDYAGTVRVEVSDGAFTEIATASVTVNNVAPTAGIDVIEQPLPDFILPTHVLTFTGSFTDPGTLDTHVAVWEFGDTASTEGLTVTHSYAAPGEYIVTFAVIDDDGGVGVSTATVTVISPQDATDTIDDVIQELPDAAFRNNPDQRKNAFFQKLEEVIADIDAGLYVDAINKLQNDIRPKCDGSFGGNPNNDWITDPDAQAQLVPMIDSLIAYLQTLL